MTEFIGLRAPASPSRDPRGILGTKINLWMAGIFCCLCALFVFIHAIDARKNGVTFWPLATLESATAILLPGATAFATYHQMKKAILASDASPAVIMEFRYSGARAVVAAYMALMMVLMATLFH
jgi:hypothetical protein